MRDCWYKDVCTLYEENCNTKCVRYTELKYLMESSNIPESRQKPISLTPDSCDYEAFTELDAIRLDICNFVEQGKNLYIGSNTTGNGKTSWAIKLMLRYFSEIWAGNGLTTRGLFVHVPTFLVNLKDFESKNQKLIEIKKLLPLVDLVIWDDIGSCNMSSYDFSQLTTYIDTRVLNQKSNIFTGNLLGDELQRVLGNRLYSRVWNTSKKIVLHGSDKRGR